MAGEIELVMPASRRRSAPKANLRDEIIKDMLESVEAKDDKIRREGKSCLSRPVFD